MIQTPETAVKLNEFTPTQLAYFKNTLKLNGGQVFALTKPSTNHVISIPVYDGFEYNCSSTNIITTGDILEDADSNTYNIVVIDYESVPAINKLKIYIASTTAYLTIDYNIVIGSFVTKFGTAGSGDGAFGFVHGIYVTSTNIYVVDSGNNRVQIFDLDGNFVSKFGTSGTGNGQFNSPRSIYVTSTNIYVTDASNDRVQIFDLAGTYVSQFGTTGTGNGQFNNPHGIAVNLSNIFVVDGLNHRVQIFNLAGTYVSQFGSSGSGDGQFNQPFGIYLYNNKIYVADSSNNRLQKFSISGTFESVIDIENVNGPRGFKVTDGVIYSTDYSGNKIRVYDFLGNQIQSFGIAGSGNSQFDGPYDLFVANNRMYVTDRNNNRIQIFK